MCYSFIGVPPPSRVWRRRLVSHLIIRLSDYPIRKDRKMSGEEVEEARDWVPIGTSSWNGGGGGSSENRGVAGFPEGVRGKIELPSKLSAVPIDDDMEKADKISELRSNGFGASSSSSSSGGGKGRRKEDDRKSSIINRLTKEQYEDICYSFSLFDVNGDEKIDKGEITHASKILGSREDIAALLGDPGTTLILLRIHP